MNILKITFLLSIFLVAFNKKSLACSPCGALSNVTQTLNGTNLELTFSSNAGWQCCYTVQIEIVCANANFTGIANYFSAENCINGGGASSTTVSGSFPYPNTIIDLSGYCPGNYKWRAKETSCNIYTPVFTFTLGGVSPIQIALNTVQDTICSNQNTILNSNASNGCNSNNFTYLWTPAAGLNNPNLANPVAAPTSTTTYTLTVSEAGSCTLPQTSNLTITVNPLPVATISGTVSVCQNTANPAVTFTGSGGTAPYTINYTLNGAPQTAIITSGTTTISVPTSTQGVYTYGLTSIQDSSSTQCIQNQTETAIVTVNQLPLISAGIDQFLCEPNNQTPSTVTLNGSGGVSYVWNNGAINGTAFTPPIGETVYTVVGTDANGCTGTDQMMVSSLTLSLATISGTVTVCQNTANPSITFTGAGGTAPYTINYTLNGTPQSAIITSGTTTISAPTSTPGVYTYLLTSIQDASTTQCSEAQTGTVVVTVNQLPVIGAGLDQVICEPNNQTPSTVTLNGSGGTSYVWNNGVTNGTTFTPPIGQTIYTVIGTDANGCTGTDQVMVTSLTLSIATISGTVSVCQNSTNPLVTFSGSGGTAPYTINYTLNGTPQTAIITSGTTTISAPTSTPGVYTYVLTSIEDASIMQCSEAQIGIVVVTVNQLPVIGAGLDQTLCEPNDQTPSTVTLSGSGGVSYVWNNGVTNGTTFTPPIGQTIYTVTGTDANGCTGTDQVMITSLNLPVAYHVPSDTLGNVLFTVSFTNLSQFGNTYTWDFGDGETYATSTTETVTHTYDQQGTYTITILASNYICSETWSSDIFVFPPMIVEPPNIFTPNGDGINDFYFVNVENVEFFEATISNRWGNIMTKLNSPMQKWDGKTDGQEAIEGVYFIQFKAVDYGGNTIENHTFFHLNRQ